MKYILLLLLMACQFEKELDGLKDSEPVKKTVEVVETVHRDGKEPPKIVKKDLDSLKSSYIDKWNRFKLEQKRISDSLAKTED